METNSRFEEVLEIALTDERTRKNGAIVALTTDGEWEYYLVEYPPNFEKVVEIVYIHADDAYDAAIADQHDEWHNMEEILSRYSPEPNLIFYKRVWRIASDPIWTDNWSMEDEICYRQDHHISSFNN